MWDVLYQVSIPKPSTHYVKVRLKLTHSAKTPDQFEIFLPSWSPGSYLLREYAKHLRCLKVTNHLGEELEITAKSKSAWIISPYSINPHNSSNQILIDYEVYCHEVSVRTSFIDESHAFLHGPTYLMGVVTKPSEILKPIIEFAIPEIWSKISTVLPEVPNLSREKFQYQAASYDELWDCPVELGCHATDGFKLKDQTYEVAIYGEEFPHKNNLKADMKIITETINTYWGDVPFKHYLYLIHLMPNAYGGLEHANSTVLMYDGRKLAIRKEYLSFLSLVAHEYFHAWNVKRIRPLELGPFDYQNENYTAMLWLAEGLTKFMDDYFVLLANMMSIEEYCDFLKSDLNAYFKTVGRKYDTLESSSWGAWIKLYRPHENSANSSISYYLKGGLVFLSLHLELKKKNLSLKILNLSLWERFKNNPSQGITKNEFTKILEDMGAGEQIIDMFEDYISTTKEINFAKHFEIAGLTLQWENERLDFGIDVESIGDRLIIKSLIEDGAAFQSGLNAQDEIIAINNQRILKSDWDWFAQQLQENIFYKITVSRQGMLTQCEVMAKKSVTRVASIKVEDVEKFKLAFELLPSSSKSQ